MAIKGAVSIAEYAIRKWMDDQGFVPEYFGVKMEGRIATITDGRGDTLRVRYDPDTKTVTEVVVND